MDQARSDLAHLYRRAGFGGRPEELDAATRAGYEATVETLLAGAAGPDPAGDAVTVPGFAPYARRSAAPGTPAALAAARAAQQAYRPELVALQAWWLDRMIVTATPLREKMTLLWHGHFATAVSKVRDPQLMYRQNQLFRTAGTGSFESLVQSVAKDGAMMVWLDTATDKKAHPNENFARELMELFTLGVGHYSQSDVEQAARAFTGWAYDRVTDRFLVRHAQHDSGTKTFLGRTGDLSGEDVLSIIVNQPACARFVTAKVWSHLAYPVTAADPVVTQLLPAYTARYGIDDLLRAIFLHPAFRSPAARTGLVKQPIEYLVGAARALRIDAHLRPAAGSVKAGPAAAGTGGRPRPGATLAALATTLGQTPFNPTNVGGWPQNAYWLNTATALARLDAAQALARQADLGAVEAVPSSQRLDTVAHLLGIDGWSAPTGAALAHAASDPRNLVALALTAPEYVLN